MSRGIGAKQRKAIAVLDHHRWQSTIAVAHSMGIEDEIGIRSVRRSLDKLYNPPWRMVDKTLSHEFGGTEARWRLKTPPTKRAARPA